jgi:hypothetical protein
MKGKTNHKSHAGYIAAVERARRDDIQALHDLVRDEAPELEPTMDSAHSITNTRAAARAIG